MGSHVSALRDDDATEPLRVEVCAGGRLARWSLVGRRSPCCAVSARYANLRSVRALAPAAARHGVVPELLGVIAAYEPPPAAGWVSAELLVGGVVLLQLPTDGTPWVCGLRRGGQLHGLRGFAVRLHPRHDADAGDIWAVRVAEVRG